MLIQFLIARSQFYMGGMLGVSFLNRTIKTQHYKQLQSSQEVDMSHDFLYAPDLEENTGVPYIKDIAYNDSNWISPRSQVGLTLGINIPWTRDWNLMFDSVLGMNALSGFNIHAKALIRHNIGFFGGLGVEFEHTWNLTHPTKTIYANFLQKENLLLT